MVFGRYKIAFDKSLGWKIGKIKYTLYYIKWAYHVGPFYISSLTFNVKRESNNHDTNR